MANNDENFNSPNEETFDLDIYNLDETAAKETLREILPKYKETSDKNRQLYERAKKAEGFELKDGKWVKPPKAEPKVDADPPKEPSKPSELDYGQMALLRQEGIKGAGETALFKEIMAETGKGVLY